MKSKFIKGSIVLMVFLLSIPMIAQKPAPDSTIITKILNGHTGAFVSLDLKKDEYFRYNSKRCAERFLPASTFKIPNSLIGLESGVIPDENFIIKWDGIKRWNDGWNRDHTLATAIKYSVVPYYQELARRVGRKDYEKYLKNLNYGNKIIGKKIDVFWLNNSLKISANEQIIFLKELYEYKLHFSKRNIDIAKKIMSGEKYSGSLLKFKTGTGQKEDGVYIGWLVGYVEKENNDYVFAFNVEAKTFEEVRSLRDSTSRDILKYLKIIE